ncbi:hypothetical protein BJ138DRAFT_438402 [Hygrophoropsis aurantiaca]|uniref:Uncharacterized protein n=1 Tax=Hygrophoropsis aurantiaca TaxID=72124 RepID=A0ACB8A3S7_9AGAM|nr:hypothetical protein BJ138DRAFT_438402 [Hygrophoropsis aurantiaca]
MASRTPTSLDSWASKYAHPVSPHEWPTQLWESAWKDQADIFSWENVVRDNQPVPASELRVPSRMCVIRGSENELGTRFGARDGYMKSDYIIIAQQLVKYATDQDQSSDPMEVDEVDEDLEERLPTNPFVQANMDKPLIMQVCGSPGNGKSLFLHVLLRLRLSAMLPTLLQFNNGACYLFTDLGVHIIGPSTLARESSLAQDLGRLIPDAWCLVDSNVDMPIPSSFTRYSGLTIVQAASPRADRLDWVGKYSRPVKEFYMRPFNLTEAIVARGMQISARLPSERQLQLWYDRYAPSARLAYGRAARIDDYEASLQRKLTRTIGNSTLSLLSLFRNASSFSNVDEVSHEVFTFFPTSDTAAVSCHIPTRHLAGKVVEALCAVTDAKRAEIYRTFLRVPGLQAAAGYLMEELANNILPLGGTPWRLWKLERAKQHTTHTTQHWTVNPKSNALWFTIQKKNHLPTMTISRTKSTSSSATLLRLEPQTYDTDTFKSPGKLKNGYFYTPKAPNQATFDSFIYQDGTAYLLQYTVAKHLHDVKAKGLEFIKGLGVTHIIYIGVVPSGQRPTIIINKSTAKKYKDLITDFYLLDFDPPA